MVILPNQSVFEDMEASYLDLGSVNDSRKGGPENQRRWRMGQVKEVGIQVSVGHPSPNI